MPRPKNPIPTYRRHKSGQAVVSIIEHGRRRDVYLGVFDSPASKREYERVLARLREHGNGNGTRTPEIATASESGSEITVDELLLAFLRHADAYYRHPDGKPTSEPANYRHSIQPLRESAFGRRPAVEFGPRALKTVRDAMVARGWSRPVVNKSIIRIKHIFKWAASEELVIASVYHALSTVQGLRAGRTTAPEPNAIKPVERWVRDETLRYAYPTVADMIRVHWHTGSRPGELCRMTAAEIDMTGKVWLYRPRAHKTAYRGQQRTISIGPAVQSIILARIGDDPTAPIFSPRTAQAERFAMMREQRKSKVPPSQACRRRDGAKQVGEFYTTSAYHHAIRYAVRRANRERGDSVPPLPEWHPNQIRHSAATEIRAKYGLEAAQVFLGHSRADVTQVYAERDVSKAMNIAMERE